MPPNLRFAARVLKIDFRAKAVEQKLKVC